MYQSSVVNYLIAAIFLNQKVRARNIWVSCFFFHNRLFGICCPLGAVLKISTFQDASRKSPTVYAYAVSAPGNVDVI